MDVVKGKQIKPILMFFGLAISTLLITGCQSEDNVDSVRSDVLLDNVISEGANEFMFEDIAWGKTKQDLIEDDHITEKDVSEGAAESFMLNDTVTFKDPESEATVLYQFESDVFLGGEYSIEAKDEDDLVDIAGTLKDQLKETVGEPDSNSLNELAEESVRNGSSGITYLDAGAGSLEITFPQNEDLTIVISTRGPRDVLEEHILEKQK